MCCLSRLSQHNCRDDDTRHDDDDDDGNIDDKNQRALVIKIAECGMWRQELFP